MMKRRNPTAIGPAPSYCNRAYTIRVELLTIGQEVHMATFAAHVLKGLPPKYGFLRRKLEISSPDMTVERVCSEVLMEEQTLSIEQSYKQITSDASAFSGAVITIVATTGVNGKEEKGGREQTDKMKDGKREKKRAPFKGRCYNCNEEGHMAAKCPNKKKYTTLAAASTVAEGDGKGVALTVTCLAAKLLADDKDLWFLDSGCSQYMTGRKEWYTVIRDPSATKSVKGFDGSMHEVAGVARNGATAAAACNGTAAASACTDMAGGAASNGTGAASACNGTAAAAACTDMAGGAASNGTGAASACNGMPKAFAEVVSSAPQENDEAASLTTYAVGTEAMLNLRHTHLENDHAGAVQWTATNSGMLGMDLEKGGEDTSSASSQEAKLTRQTLPLPDEREGEPTPPLPCHSSRSNKGMPPVRFPKATMTASDADDGNNMYDMAFLAGGVYGTDIYYDVEYLDEADEEEGGLGSVIINLGVTLTGPEGKVVDKGLLVVKYMSSTEGYLGLQIVRDRPNKTLLLHENAYVRRCSNGSSRGRHRRSN
ncbi:unnamed protein product [Closterium sp. Naga37s-1]|nr:unnamed protein product [Closterium sp. Naga37s-1]